MRIDEIISENEFDWVTEVGEKLFQRINGKIVVGRYAKPEYRGIDANKIATDAKAMMMLPDVNWDQDTAIDKAIEREVKRRHSKQQKPAPKSTPAPQKSAPKEPEVKRSRGAQIGNQNAFKGGPTASPTTVVGKVLQKGKEKAQQWGGIKQGAQRRNRKLNNFS